MHTLATAQACVELGRYQDAVSMLAPQAAAGEPQAGLLLSVCLARLGYPADAADAARRVLEYHPDWAPPYAQLARSASLLGRHQEAKEAAARALALDPGSVGSWEASFWAAASRHDWSEASKASVGLLELAPHDCRSHTIAGFFFLMRSRPGAEEAAFRRALSLDPDDADARRGLADSLGSTKREAGAWELRRSQLRELPTDARSVSGLRKSTAVLRLPMMAALTMLLFVCVLFRVRVDAGGMPWATPVMALMYGLELGYVTVRIQRLWNSGATEIADLIRFRRMAYTSAVPAYICVIAALTLRAVQTTGDASSVALFAICMGVTGTAMLIPTPSREMAVNRALHDIEGSSKGPPSETSQQADVLAAGQFEDAARRVKGWYLAFFAAVSACLFFLPLIGQALQVAALVAGLAAASKSRRLLGRARPADIACIWLAISGLTISLVAVAVLMVVTARQAPG